MIRLVLLLVFALSTTLSVHAQRFITDTVWYNARWEICEEPIARYYRVGNLVTDDTLWFWSGPVRDYTRKHQLLMEGGYNSDGWRNGIYKFYWPNGKVRVYGRFENGYLKGIWQWFYASGVEQAAIQFGEESGAFAFIRYMDSLANTTLEKGSGDFSWTPTPFDEEPAWTVRGHFEKGRRKGKWQFRSVNPSETFESDYREHYDENGIYVKTTGARIYRKFPTEFSFLPKRIERMESLAFDRFFRSEGDTAVQRVVYWYLTEKKTPEFILKRTEFDSAMGSILNTLERYRFYFDFEERAIEGKIEFRIGPAGYPEDVTITSKNTDSSEIAFLYFLMNKFRNVQMPTAEGVDFEGYHTIHFYVLSLRKYLPVEIRPYVDKDLMFSVLTSQELTQKLEANKKNFKRLIRRAYYRN